MNRVDALYEIWVGLKEQARISWPHLWNIIQPTVVRFCCLHHLLKGIPLRGKKHVFFFDRVTRESLIWMAGDLSDTNDTYIQRLDLKTFGAVTLLIFYAIMAFFLQIHSKHWKKKSLVCVSVRFTGVPWGLQ